MSAEGRCCLNRVALRLRVVRLLTWDFGSTLEAPEWYQSCPAPAANALSIFITGEKALSAGSFCTRTGSLW
jgi:hypothetical protein